MPRARRTPREPDIDPQTGAQTYSSEALADAVGVHPKTILQWLREGLLPAVRFEGPATRYGRQHVRLGRAIAKAGVEAARLPCFAELVPTILGEPPPAAPTGPPAEALISGTTWAHVELVPGVELHVRGDVPPALRAVAREVASKFGKAV